MGCDLVSFCFTTQTQWSNQFLHPLKEGEIMFVHSLIKQNLCMHLRVIGTDIKRIRTIHSDSNTNDIRMSKQTLWSERKCIEHPNSRHWIKFCPNIGYCPGWKTRKKLLFQVNQGSKRSSKTKNVQKKINLSIIQCQMSRQTSPPDANTSEHKWMLRIS